MNNIHMIVGTLVIVMYLITFALNIRTARSGKEFSWQKMVSFGAATFLLLQYMLGFSLLGEGNNISAFHYLIALAAIIPVGMEHAYASQRPDAVERGKMAALANLFTIVLVLVAYMIGEMN
jgi:heme A synthase